MTQNKDGITIHERKKVLHMLKTLTKETQFADVSHLNFHPFCDSLFRLIKKTGDEVLISDSKLYISALRQQLEKREPYTPAEMIQRVGIRIIERLSPT
jgi:hypothetical protein